jgi:predicted glycogen debranching enzyme
VVVFRYGTQVCGSLADGGRREWIVADGRGGYAMGTVSGLRTRRYHGLLVVAPESPARRLLGLAALDPVLTLPSGARVRLATHEWRSGAVNPAGYTLLETFELVDGLPRWRWRVGDIVLERKLAMRYGEPGVAVVDTLCAGGPVRLSVEPVCTWRDAHGERHAGAGLDVATTADGFVVEGAYRVAGPGYESDGEWYHGVHHREEAARGLEPAEDMFRPGRFTATLEVGDALGVSAWYGDAASRAAPPPPPSDVVAAARRRARDLAAPGVDDVDRSLRLAADAFVVVPGHGGPDVVAGYPWFGVWSRDTMTSYEGLFLTTGRGGPGRELLRAYAGTLSEGMLANTADGGRTEYNTADATLWFLHAVDRHVATTGDVDLAAELIDRLDGVVRAHLDGTRFGIGVDPADGLLRQGADGVALTWMDAVVTGEPVTPRRGKPVELNALWVNGLAALATLRARVGRDAADLRAPLERATGAFRRRFPAPSGWLYDVVDPPAGSEPLAGSAGSAGDDAALRPNQVLAFGLPYAPMRGSDPAPLAHVTRALLTPLGPRTLDPVDPAYRGTHRGDPATRDGAYHQGTVWPWLVGPLADALEVAAELRWPDPPASPALSTADVLSGLIAHLGEWGVGSVSETADGDAPHQATGCPFQAWSVAEVLRTYQRI